MHIFNQPPSDILGYIFKGTTSKYSNPFKQDSTECRAENGYINKFQKANWKSGIALQLFLLISMLPQLLSLTQ